MVGDDTVRTGGIFHIHSICLKEGRGMIAETVPTGGRSVTLRLKRRPEEKTS